MTPDPLHASTVRGGDVLAASISHEAAAPGPASPCLLLRPHETVVGECLDTRHPSLAGRVLVHWSLYTGPGGSAWLPTLHGIPVCAGDRVLLTQPSNAPEPIVLGVIDGFAPLREPQRDIAPLPAPGGA
jgi:hypothetical protein